MEIESKKWVAADLDGTFNRRMLGMDLVHELWRQRYIPHAKMEALNAARSGFIDRTVGFKKMFQAFHDALYTHDAIGGISFEAYDAAAEAVVKRYGGRVFVFTRELLAAAREAGYLTAAISGSMSPAVERFSKLWGFDAYVGTKVHVEGDRVSSARDKDKGPMLDKANAVERMAEQLGVASKPTIAMGDTLHDLPMLQLAMYPIAFNPDVALEREARRLGIPVVKERKDAIVCLRTMKRHEDAWPERFCEIRIEECVPTDIERGLSRRLQALDALSY